MEYDLLLRGGLVVDGSGLPGCRADVGVRDGRIAALGRLRGSATRTLDVDGLVVAPGFIDHHTHLDAQLLWDPYGTCEPQHGVTTVITGNCGLTLAPVQAGLEDELVTSFVRVEAIPRPVLAAGVRWGWHSFGEYLSALDGRLGINVGGLVGHIALRHYVLRAEALERRATPDEVAQMQALVRAAMAEGALGLSTNRNERHNREDGRPVASRLADDDEFFALCDVLGECSAGVIETTLGAIRLDQLSWYDALARRTGRPVVWQAILPQWNAPTLWRQQLDGIAPTFRDGYRAYATTNTTPIMHRFTLANAQMFDEYPTWKPLLFGSLAARKQAFADPATRNVLRGELANPERPRFYNRWHAIEIVEVALPEHAPYVGQSVAAVAAARGQDPFDAFLDLSLEADLQTAFWSAATGGDPEAMAEILRSPYVLVGLSDAGAHVEFNANFGYGTTLLGLWVRQHGALSLEQAVHKLSFEVASVYGLTDRGLVRPRYAADLVVFDPATVGASAPEFATDFPQGARRMVQRASGVPYTVVNGRVIQEEGRLSGELPGQVLRSAAARR